MSNETAAPRISVLMPVYNAGPYLREALESALTQTLKPFEVVVLDDGSTDDSLEVARSVGGPVQVHSQPNAGSSAARNQAARLARGDFLAFFDADDVAAPNRLEMQAAVFAADPAVEIVFSHLAEFFSPDLDADSRAKLQCHSEAVPGRCVGTMMLRKTVFAEIGEFDTSLRIAYFMKWYAIAEERKRRAIMLPDTLVHRRIHATNVGIRFKHLQAREYATVLKFKLNRRRNRPEP